MGVRAALAVHPASGRGAAARVSGTVAERLREVVDHLSLAVADTVDESRELMRRAADAGLDVLVVIGGDGSMHQGVQFCAEHGVALGIVPAGTGNDLARALGVPGEPHAALDHLAASLADGARRTIDLGKVGDTWFATVLCAGFDSAVNERANALRWPSGPRRYDVAVVAELARLRPAPLIVDTDAGRLETEATLVAVGNTAYYGGGIPVCPDADPSDGLFDVTLVGAAHRRDLLRLLPTLRSGRHIDHPAVTTLRASRVTLEPANGWTAYADGDPLRPLPLTTTCVSGALAVVG
ncbi:diacylglycerol kinase [Herbihabitans rhizosphaerae]|uniref:Diacylglycerol kinase n=1 Tax=Herbihabitans rhizosphaerae TaxID=1872711 RepID=A0A4Q7L3F9_9PSEU|nr:YegS/Rv2252/BmrU family lipid kinase [Herbihabitans rhizosphaerae]RZS43775.1 diacylglycerol kinase [Herbihabitans rhizosphaerae]